jgi:hypothetical protein
LASADATLTLSKGASVVGGVLSVGGPAATFVAGGRCFLSSRLVCTLSAICRSNEQIYAGFWGQVGTPAFKNYALGQEKGGGKSDGEQVNGMVEFNRGNKCF